MSERENLRVVGGLYEAFGRGDAVAVFAVMTEDIEWFLPGPPGALPFAGLRRGRDEVAEFFAVLAATLEFVEFEPREFVAQGDKVVVTGRSRDRVRATGRVADNEWAAVFTMRGGKIAGYRIYEDTHALVEAARPDPAADGAGSPE